MARSLRPHQYELRMEDLNIFLPAGHELEGPLFCVVCPICRGVGRRRRGRRECIQCAGHGLVLYIAPVMRAREKAN